MARIPGIDSAFAVAMATAATAQHTAGRFAGRAITIGVVVVGEVASQVRSVLNGTVGSATQARETIAVLHRLAIRAEVIAGELEEPLLALKPGLLRLADVLDDPTISEVPETLRRVQDDVLPVLRSLADTHDKVAFIAGSTERIMAFVDDTSRTIAHLPGAALLSRRGKPAPEPAGTVVVADLDR